MSGISFVNGKVPMKYRRDTPSMKSYLIILFPKNNRHPFEIPTFPLEQTLNTN
jgi:hypothetical protein